MKIIATCNLKGGVAKTTTTVNLAADLARDHGQRVLVIDADSQANTTAFLAAGAPSGGFAATSLGEETPSVTAASGGASEAGNVARSPRVGISLREGAEGDTLADLLRTPAGERVPTQASHRLEAVIRPASFKGVDLLPADNSLMDLDLSKAESDAVYTAVLADGLPDLQKRYDFVLIDCPPAFNAASAAALLAADEVLIPIKLDAFALDGMANLMQQIANMRRINPRLRVLGLLPVMWYRSAQISEAEEALRLSGLPVLPRIRRSNRVDDMTFAQEPLCVCSPKSGACQDYRHLAARIAGRAKGGEGNG